MPRMTRRVVLNSTVFLMTVRLAFSQGGAIDKFSDDASATFAILADQAGIGFFGDRAVFETIVKNSHLSRTNGDDKFGLSWSKWEGQNSSGHVTVYASFPSLQDKKQNRFWVRFDSPLETPMPQALLSHLLGKARETAVSSGDTLEVKLPLEFRLGGCAETYTLRIRLTNGSLVSTSVEDSCPVK